MTDRKVTPDDLRRVADAIREIGAALGQLELNDNVAKRIRAARHLVAELATPDPLEDSGFLEGGKTEASGAFTLPPLPDDDWK
jgi:hypothetical protein